MSDPFLAEIRMMSFGYAPNGWALCDGQTLAINQNTALFSLLGTAFGGDGIRTFKLPNLQGLTPIHTGQGHKFGDTGGEANHTLSIPEMPQHVHPVQGTSTTGNVEPPANHLLAASPALIYNAPGNLTSLQPGTVGNAGGSQAHNNMQPYLTINFCIALQGIFPSPN
jgi:microcystin-dependent protein